MKKGYIKSSLRKQITRVDLGRTMLEVGLALMAALALSSVVGSAASTFISSTNVLEIDGSGVFGVGGPINSALFTTGGPFDAGVVNWNHVNVASFSSVGSNDTVILFQVNTVSGLTAAQKATLVSFVTGGGKLIIWDSDAGATTITPNDYSWLPATLNFNTSVPGQLGARGGILMITEENDLSSNISSNPKFINTSNITQFTDAVGDANVVKTNGTDWCQDMFAQNRATPPQSGPGHMYSRLGSSVGNGFIVYSALDWDFATGGGIGGNELRKMLQFELEVNNTSNLPCQVPVVAPKGSISGMKFDDLNGNGVNDAEPGLAGWNITLTNESGGVVTQTTASDGSYNFTNLTDGNYTVGEVLQNGWIQTAPAVSTTGSATYKVQISGGNNIGNQDFGNFKLGEVQGMKFEDLNANGIKDQNEAGLAGWQINLTGTDTITGTPVSLTTTTDANGNYNFTGLTNGTYTISETMQNGWVQTAPATSTYTVTVTSGAAITGQDFGNFHKGKITGGGWISITGDPKATFGLVGQYPDSSNTAQGNVEYQDHIANLNIKSIQINIVATTLDKKKGVITGLAQVNGAGSYPFVVYVEDNAEPGKGIDVFSISLPTYPYSNGAILSSGNIQIHS